MRLNSAVEKVARLLCVRRSRVQTLAWRPAVLNDIVRGLLQFRTHMAESYVISDHIASYYSQDRTFIAVTELEAVQLGYPGSISSRCRFFLFYTVPRPACGPPRLSGD